MTLKKWFPVSNRIKERLWGFLFKVVFFLSQIFSVTKESPAQNIQADVSEDTTSTKSLQKNEPTLEVLIKQIVALEEKIQKIDENDPLINFGIARNNDERAWIEARRIQIESYCISHPFNENNPTDLREAAEGYLHALSQRLNEIE